MKKLGIFIIALNFLFGVPFLYAKDSQSVNVIASDLSYTEISGRLKEMEGQIKKETVTTSDLKDYVDYIGNIRSKLAESKKNIENDIKFVEKRIEALGEAPADGNEVKIIAQKRKEFNQELANEKARLSEADILLAKLDELDLMIFNVRNQELWGNLLVRSEPLIYPVHLLHATKLFLGLVIDIAESPFQWYEKLTPQQKDTVHAKLIPVFLVVVFISWVGWILRKLIIRHLGYRSDVEHPRFGRKILAAIAVWIAYGVIPTLIIGSFLAWIISGKILTSGFFGLALNSFLFYSLYVIMGRAICRVILTPYNEKWRLINISTEKARRVTRALYISVALIGVLAYFSHIVKVHNYPIELMTYLVAASAVIKTFCIVWIVHRFFWDGESETDAEAEDLEEENETESNDSFIFQINFFMFLYALVILGMSVFGYPYLAGFITSRFIFSILTVIMFIGLRKIIYEALHRLLVLRFWVKTFRMRRRLIRKLDFWLGIIIDPVLVLGGIFALLALWGMPTDILRNIIYKLFTGFTVGGIRISLISVILGIVVFFVAIAVVRTLRNRIENNILARMEIDDGTKHSLAAGFSFLGYVASALLAVAIMGGNLNNVALVAGALSVGIGLGLQNIVNNFVSGIILLFERPVKVGDWVVINGEEGKIKQINIRATEVETFNRASVIIPNATLLSTSVTNLTHGNNWMRFKVTVGVAYGSDTQRVKEILLEVAANNKKVLKKPEPYVLFQDFGPSSLNFELRGYSSDIWSGWTIPSDLRFEINRRFIEEGIEIPFNQLVVHTGSQVSETTENQFYAAKRKKKKTNVDK